LIRTEQLEWLDRLEADHDNLRLALEWALGKESAEFVLRLCAALGMFWYIHCHWKEGARWLEKALARPSENASANEKIARARAFYQDAGLAHQLDDVKRGGGSFTRFKPGNTSTSRSRNCSILYSTCERTQR
jgi:uncharacterized protein HemY